MRKYTEELDPWVADKYRITFDGVNAKGESVYLEINKCEGGKAKNSLMNLWVKNGYLKEFIPYWWHIDTEVFDGTNSWRRYNSQEKPYIRKNNKGKVVECHNVIEFEWLLPATEENRLKIIREVSRLAFNE